MLKPSPVGGWYFSPETPDDKNKGVFPLNAPPVEQWIDQLVRKIVREELEKLMQDDWK